MHEVEGRNAMNSRELEEVPLSTVVGLLMADAELIRISSSLSGCPESATEAMEIIVEHMLSSCAGWRHGALFLDRALPAPLCDWTNLETADLLARLEGLNGIEERAGLLWLVLRKRMPALHPILSKLTQKAQTEALRQARRNREAFLPISRSYRTAQVAL